MVGTVELLDAEEDVNGNGEDGVAGNVAEEDRENANGKSKLDDDAAFVDVEVLLLLLFAVVALFAVEPVEEEAASTR